MSATIESKIEKHNQLIARTMAHIDSLKEKMDTKKRALKIYTKTLKELERAKNKSLPKLVKIVKAAKVVSIRRGRPKKVAQV